MRDSDALDRELPGCLHAQGDSSTSPQPMEAYRLPSTEFGIRISLRKQYNESIAVINMVSYNLG